MNKNVNNSFPFGKSLAAIKMETLVDVNPVARRKISRLLSRYTDQLHQIIHPQKDAATTRLLLHLLCQYNLVRTELMNIDDDVRSYIKNLIKSRYRVFLHGYNKLAPQAESEGKLLRRNQKRKK